MRVSRNPEPGSADGAGSTAAALLHVEIKDTGVGIATHELEQVFEAFEQTESGQRSKQGTGLGLPISREYVRMMGGELTVTSQVGVGSCFSFDLPVEVVDAAQVRDARRARQAIGLAAGQPTYKLLVTDDVEASRQLLVKLLDPLGFDVRQAMDGREAIEIWRSWQPDFIFMDMRMPRIDGREATRRIRAFPQGQEVIIVALTAGTFEEEREAILAQGCDDVVLKPFLATTIFSMLERHLGVQFVYREPDGRVGMERAERPTGHPSPDAALDPDWVADMHQATVEGDIQHMERLVAQIRETHPAVAERLTSLARDFAHGEILGLLDRMAS
jgi:CheY-like chemotaxis protein